jgi:DNA excision repair protein ERCC-6
MSGEDLSSLGVEVRSVAHFAADVAATADAAAEAAELVDYTTRDSALAADIDCFRRELELERVKRQPNAACMQSLRRKIETAEVKRRSLTAAFQARQELAARVAAEASATVSSAGNVPGAQDAKGSDGAVRMAAETQRDFDIRTGKITPFHVGEGAAEMFQRRQKTAYTLPLARKRRRPAVLKDAASAGRARGGIDTGKLAESDDDDDGDSDDDGIHHEEDVGSDWSFDSDSLAEDSDNDDFDSDDEGDMRRRKTSADKAAAELVDKDEDSDGEEVVIDGGLSMPASLFDKLFEYQKTGIKWLAELHNACCGGCLADEMGLGKTVTVVAFLAALQYSGKLPGPVIIVAPATVLKQWARHFQDWWPRFHVRILHQSSAALEVSPRAKRQRKLSTVVLNPNDVICDVTQSKEHAVLVTSYEQVRKHQGKLLDKFEYVVLDEGTCGAS